MTDVNRLSVKLQEKFPNLIQHATVKLNELTLDVLPDNLLALCAVLKDDSEFDFQMLLDVCGVDYLHYGIDEWETESATATGFERGVDRRAIFHTKSGQPRFASVY